MVEQKGKHQQDEFVSKIVKDPKNPPNVILLSGFLGASSESGYTRLYFDAQLSSYVEIPNDAILYTQAKSKEESALGGSYVWINKDAELIHGKISADRTKGKFFEGPIVQEYFKGGGPIPGDFDPIPYTRWNRNCKTIYPAICTAIPECPTNSGPCWTNFGPNCLMRPSAMCTTKACLMRPTAICTRIYGTSFGHNCLARSTANCVSISGCGWR